MKAINELIQLIESKLSLLEKNGDWSNDLWSVKVKAIKVKEQLQEQHKEDVVKAYKYGLNDEFSDYLDRTEQAEQYYQQNHIVMNN